MRNQIAVANRRSFDRNIASVFADARSGLGEFSLLIADIDDFKLYNDTYGHTEGDRVLRKVAQTIQMRRPAPER
jgi:diguanylate cyclase (GGDEF)-like protein